VLLNRYNVVSWLAALATSFEPLTRPEANTSNWAVKGLSMEKWLCWASMGVSGLLLILFLLDLIIRIPFGGFGGIGLGRVVDILGLVSCVLVLYMSWDALRDWR
jgi:hypothetical protein